MGEKDMDGFKPIKNEKSVISIRIDREMLCIIDMLANETDISRNEMIIQCIDYALKNSKIKKG
jgi:predicted HicB family RNase H-like nuclease